MKVRFSSDGNELELDLNSLTSDDLELAFDGVISSSTLLEAAGYTAGDIQEGLAHAAAIIQACQKAAAARQKATTKKGGKK